MKKKLKSSWNAKKIAALLGLVALFIGLRVFSLQESFWFFGDLGRDIFVLQQWAGNLLRPPLLGPQTSVVSFNQSAWYYYYLFPFFLISGHSVYSTLIATLTLYLAVFIGGLTTLVKKRHWRLLAALFYLLAIHPQFVLQHRYVWNPSLVTPFLLAGFWSWWRYQFQKDWRFIALFTASLAVAAGLNFSLIPTVLVITGLFMWEQRQNKRGLWQFVLLGILANLLVHLPTLAFEVRHDFLLSKNLPTQELLQQEPQLDQKISLLFAHLFLPTQFGDRSLLVGLAVIFILLFVFFRSERMRANWTFVRSLQIAALSAGLLLLTPFRVHEHYIFGILTFLLVALARLPKKLLWAVLAVLSVLYLQPYYWQLYQRPAPHSVEEQRVCLQKTCELIISQGLEPIFVNTHSSSHNHQAREYVFWLREFGCSAIDTQEFLIAPTQYMAVVADRAEFTNGETGYYELSQFGPATEETVVECKPDLRIHLMKKAQEPAAN